MFGVSYRIVNRSLVFCCCRCRTEEEEDRRSYFGVFSYIPGLEYMLRCSLAALSKNKASLQYEGQRNYKYVLSVGVGENTELFGMLLLAQAKTREPNCVQHIVSNFCIYPSRSTAEKKKKNTYSCARN